MFGYITLLTGLSLSIVAAWFAIEGIMALFAGLPTYAMIMGIVIEAGKVVGVTWIYRNWSNRTKLKYVMLPVVIVGMGLTSMGIYGLLSKAHIEQTAPVANNDAKIERLDQRIAREQADIADAEAQIAQLDETLQVLIDANIISDPVRGARVVRERQQPERDLLKQEIDESMDAIDEYEDEKLELNQELNLLELEVGPVKYIAALVYEDPDTNLEKTVRIVIIAFIFVFDPMAIMLLMAGNYTLMRHQHLFDDEGDDLPTPPFRKVIPNAEVSFTPSEEPKEFTDPECERLKEEREEMEREKADKAKSVEIPAEPIEEEKVEEEKGPRKHTVTRPHKFGG